MRGLLVLYEGSSRMSEWVALVEEILPCFIDPTTGNPLPGLEEYWDTITGLRARTAMATRSFDEAERLQRLLIEHERKGAAVALARPRDKLGAVERSNIRGLADRLNQLGNVLLARRNPECLAVFQEDYDLSTRLNDPALAATSAFNLGHGFLLFGHQRDLKQAEAWYRRSFGLRRPHDWLGRAKCLNQLGMVALELFRDGKGAGKPNEELLKLLNQAASYHNQALSILPRRPIPDVAIAHGQLGNIFIEAGDVTSALRHWQNAIRAFEWAQDFHAAGETRRNIALGLARSGRFDDALVYARAALESYRTYGEHAAEEGNEVCELIASIKREAKLAAAPSADGVG
jgi:tetratricopeptide (TPR) repeat protein